MPRNYFQQLPSHITDNGAAVEMHKIEFCSPCCIFSFSLLAQPTAAIRRYATLFLQSFPGGCDGVWMDRAERQRVHE